MGAAGLDHMIEGFGFLGQGPGKMLESGNQLLLDRQPGGHVDRGRDHIVGGLPEINVIVGMHHLGIPGDNLRGPSRNDLVGIHVRRGAGPRLVDVQNELVVPGAGGNLLGGLGDRAGDGRVQRA